MRKKIEPRSLISQVSQEFYQSLMVSSLISTSYSKIKSYTCLLNIIRANLRKGSQEHFLPNSVCSDSYKHDKDMSSVPSLLLMLSVD